MKRFYCILVILILSITTCCSCKDNTVVRRGITVIDNTNITYSATTRNSARESIRAFLTEVYANLPKSVDAETTNRISSYARKAENLLYEEKALEQDYVEFFEMLNDNCATTAKAVAKTLLLGFQDEYLDTIGDFLSKALDVFGVDGVGRTIRGVIIYGYDIDIQENVDKAKKSTLSSIIKMYNDRADLARGDKETFLSVGEKDFLTLFKTCITITDLLLRSDGDKGSFERFSDGEIAVLVRALSVGVQLSTDAWDLLFSYVEQSNTLLAEFLRAVRSEGDGEKIALALNDLAVLVTDVQNGMTASRINTLRNMSEDDFVKEVYADLSPEDKDLLDGIAGLNLTGEAYKSWINRNEDVAEFFDVDVKATEDLATLTDGYEITLRGILKGVFYD